MVIDQNLYTKGTMKFLKGAADFFSLDIGTNAVRAVQLSGGNGNWSLVKYAYAPVDSKIATSDSAESRRRLGEIIMTAIGQSGIKSRDVVIGLPSNKTFTTVVDVPMTNDAELRATMKYQVEQYIPTSADATKVDWAKLGPSLRQQGQQEILITSVSNTYSEERLDFIEGLGFNVLAAEPDSVAMIRSLVPVGNQNAVLLLDMGEFSTDIAVVYGDAPRLIRTIPTGLSSFVKAAVQNLNVQEDQARQFILKFGLATDKLDGQVFRAIEASLDNFATEIAKSIKFFETRYTSTTVSLLQLAGFAAAMPRFSDYMATKINVPAQAANPWARVSVPQSVMTQMTPIAHEFSTAVGLAMRDGSL